MSYLERICDYKRQELAAEKRKRPLVDVKSKARDIEPPRAFREAVSSKELPVKIIAEIKKASPSRGIIVEDFDPIRIAETYEENGARALSVLTDVNFFQGSLRFIHAIKKATRLPILRKDFTLDEYHLYEARAAEADAVLLIARILEPNQLNEYCAMVREMKMSALVEIHDEADLAKLPPHCLAGLNNRNLETFVTDLNVTERLAPKLAPEMPAVSESGIATAQDIERLRVAGVSAFLVGEALLTASDMGAKLRELLGNEPRATSD